jgi:hypothetical protein
MVPSMNPELEDIGMGLLVRERLARGDLDDDLSLDELARQVDREHLLVVGSRERLGAYRAAAVRIGSERRQQHRR